MDSIWVKIAAGAVGVLVVIVLIGIFAGGDGSSGRQTEPRQQDKPVTVYDKFEEDKQLVKPIEPQVQASNNTNPTPIQPQPTQPVQPTAPVQTIITAADLTEPTVLHFKPMGEIEQIEAERILPYAGAGRSIGRLPMTGFNLMVDGCRQILQRWPDSSYAFQAKRLLAEMPERYQGRYRIKPEELDISRFMKPRQGTRPVTVEPILR